MIIVALLITLREATFFISWVTGMSILRDLITSLTILALTFSILQFKEQTVYLVNSVKDRRLSKLLGIQ